MNTHTISRTVETSRISTSREGDVRWQAVLARDARADGTFYFAVRTTRVYCRPSCPARRPKRENVAFFTAREEAERAGYRPCRRCRPAETDAAAALVARAASILGGNNEDETLSLAELARRAGSHPAALRRAFAKVTGMAPREFAGAARLAEFKKRLKSAESVTAAIYESGYGSSSRVYERSNAGLGMTPATYRQGGAGMQLGYAMADSELGRILVAATGRGVSAVYLGESEQRLLAELKREYPKAKIAPADGVFGEWVREVTARANGQAAGMDVPLDLQATAFQRRVWAELQRIPRGATRTYTEVARALKRPRAVRAVARACATNPVSVLVPCHRVVRRDRSLAGYRWGLARKEQLIRRERDAAKFAAAKPAGLSRAASRG